MQDSPKAPIVSIPDPDRESASIEARLKIDHTEHFHALVQPIEIGPTKVAVVLRLPTETSAQLWSRLW